MLLPVIHVNEVDQTQGTLVKNLVLDRNQLTRQFVGSTINSGTKQRIVVLRAVSPRETNGSVASSD